MKKRIIAAAVFLYHLLILPSTGHAQGFDSIPASSQHQFQLHSAILNEDRTVWVYMPPDYKTSTDTYPVLYLLDGDKHYNYVRELVDYLSDFEQAYLPRMIVVAIPNVDRGRDFTPVFTTNGSNGAEKFLGFIKNELIPYIDRHYRIQPYRILEAHSLGGLFATYTNGEAPGLFQASIIISPALAGESAKKVLTKYNASLKSNKQLHRKMFISLGDEKTESVDILMQQLKTAAAPSFHWTYKKYSGENHFSVPYKSMYDGLRYIYSNWFMDMFLNQKKISWNDINSHYKKLSEEFGYTIHPAEFLVNECGYQQMNFNHMEEAIGLFKQNIKDHPGSFNAYDSMGEAYMKMGEKKLAIENYEKSIQLNPGNENGKAMLKKLNGQ